MYTRSQLCSVKTFIYTHMNVILTVVNMVPSFMCSLFIVMTKHPKAMGCFAQCKLTEIGTPSYWPVPTSYWRRKKAGQRWQRKLALTQYVETSDVKKHSMSFWAELFWKPKKCQPNLWTPKKWQYRPQAKDLLGDCKDPVIWFDKVSG